MNILEIVSGAEINGAVVHCALLSTELARRGHAVTVLCRHNAKVMRLLNGAPVRIIESDMHRLPMDELRRVAAIAHETGIEIIHTHMTRAHNFGVLLRRFSHVPCVATAHSHIVQPLTWMFNDHVIAVSDATRRFQQTHNFVRNGRIETVYGFMDYDRQTAVPDDARKTVRASLDVEERTPVVGVIGDILPRKGHLYLVRALAQIVSAIPDAILVVVGDANRKIGQKYYERIEAEVHRLGLDRSIVWAGHRGDIPSVMRALDVFVLASLDEMFPVVALEAMAAGRPIVATNVGGVPECLTNEETALLVPRADPAALAGAIERLLLDTEFADRLARNARAVAQERFSLQSQTPRIEAVMREVIDRFHQGFGAHRTA